MALSPPPMGARAGQDAVVGTPSVTAQADSPGKAPTPTTELRASWKAAV